MKAMILAAGRGERLRPLTDTTPKPLIEVGGKPLIAWQLGRLKAAGVTEVVINLAHLGEQIESLLGGGAAFGVTIRYSRELEGALETGGGILRALPLLGQEPFLLVNGDIWTDMNFRELPETPEASAHLVLVDNPPGNPDGDFALVDGIVRNTGEPMLTYAGIALIRPRLLSGERPGRFGLAPLLRRAARVGEVTGQIYGGRWFDAGTPERLQALRDHLEGRNA